MSTSVLLIDDDVDLVQTNRIRLEGSGYAVRVAYTAEQALKAIAAEGPPDVAVLDVMLETDSAGFHLANELHRRFPTLPLIMLSGVNEKSGLPFRFEADETWLPVLLFLDKPVAPERLEAEIAAASKPRPGGRSVRR